MSSCVVETPFGEVFWLHTYHPNNWGAFNRQRAFDPQAKVATGWVRYAELAYEAIAGQGADAATANMAWCALKGSDD